MENLTGDHLWPSWLRTLLDPRHRGTQLPHTATSTIADFETRRWMSVAVNIKVNEVCADGNSGWVSDLEVAAKQVLTPMILDRNTTLDAEAQETMAHWITTGCSSRWSASRGSISSRSSSGRTTSASPATG
jgi:hypothetical protein